MIRSKAPSYRDGFVKIFDLRTTSPPGEVPVEELADTPAAVLRYKERMVGLTRQELAMQENINISHVLRCPLCTGVTTAQVAVMTDGSQHNIRKVQTVDGTGPHEMDLTLERVARSYELR